MSEFFSSDGPYVLQFLVIFLVILVLLLGAWLLFNRIAGRGLSRAARAGNRARQPRLGIVDIYELDRQRQLILLRRDNVEHLLLVGGPNDVVVERDVTRVALRQGQDQGAGRPEPASEPAPGLPGLDRPLPDPPAEAGPPPFEMPLAVPTPAEDAQPGAAPASRPPPLDPALFEPEAVPSERPQAPVTSRIGIAQVGRILRRTPPPLVEERPEPASERTRTEPFALPPLGAPAEPRPVDPAILSDMARQLETALRRPSSAVTPPPAQPAAAASAESPAPVAVPRPPDPIAAGMAAAQALNPPPAPAVPEPVPARVSPEPGADSKAEGKPGGSPFTVEEIETEFARLLGRPLDRKS